MFRIIALLALAIGAVAALADGPQAVLSTDGAVYTVSDESNTELRIVRRIGTQRSTYLVPTTGDDGIESDANLAWDAANKTLYVMWHRSGDRTDQIFLARFFSDGTWSDPLLVATGAQVQRVGLEMVMTGGTAIDSARLVVGCASTRPILASRSSYLIGLSR